jgi:hypothetical protein
LEVDFVLDRGNQRLALLEAKATRTPMPGDAQSLLRLAGSIKRYQVQSWLVHGGGQPREVVAAGVRPATIHQIPRILDAG